MTAFCSSHSRSWCQSTRCQNQYQCLKIINDQGLQTLTNFFDIPAARQIERSTAEPVIVASSVFTHLENPGGFIDAVKRLLTDDDAFIGG